MKYLQGFPIKSYYNNFILKSYYGTFLNINEIPFVSNYFYESRINDASILTIEYYVTDFYQLDFLRSAKKKFTVTINIGKKQNILKTFIFKDVLSGDNVCEIPIQDLSIGDYWWSIQAEDEKNRKSMKVYNEFMIYEDIVYNDENTCSISDEDLLAYNINKDGDYGDYILVDVSVSNINDVYAYLESYASNVEVDSGRYKCFMADIDGDGCSDFKIGNWFHWTEGDFQSYIKYADDYNKDLIEEEALQTTVGLRNLINDKIKEGYRKIVLPTGYYRTSTQDIIEIIGDNVVIDFNNSTIKSNKLNKPGKPICGLYGYNSHIINGNFEGCVIETDYKDFISEEDPDATSWYELGHGICICTNSKYSSFEDCTVKNITGYGLLGAHPTYVSPPHEVTKWNSWNGFTYLPSSGWILGDINEEGEYVTSNERYVYNTFVDVTSSKEFPYISINKYLGYQGLHGGSRYIECHMYDENQVYLGSEVCMQFRSFWLLPNTKYIKVVSYSNVYENIRNEDSRPLGDMRVVSHVQTVNCYMKNINVENVRCVGATPFGKNCYFDNVNIIRSGYAEAHQLLDAEDTWEKLQEFVIKNCTMNKGVDSSHLLLCSGVNTCIENSAISFMQYGRAMDTVIRNCNCKMLDMAYEGMFRTGYPRIYNNSFNSENTDYIFGMIGSNTYDTTVYDRKCIINNTNIFVDGEYGSTRNTQIVFKDITFNMAKRNCKNGTLLADYDNCIVNELTGKISNVRAKNCEFNLCNITIDNNHNSYYYDSLFNDCVFNNCIVINNTELSNNELFKNCEFLNNDIEVPNFTNLIPYNPLSLSSSSVTNGIQRYKGSIEFIDNNVVKFTATADGGIFKSIINFTPIANHKYYFRAYSSTDGEKWDIHTSLVVQADNNSANISQILFNLTNIKMNETRYIKNPLVIDLTEIYGEGNEPNELLLLVKIPENIWKN